MRSTSPFDYARPLGAGYRDITPAATHEAAGRVRLIDVREPSELAAEGLIRGSENVPLALVEAKAPGWNKEEEIVLICRSGRRSAVAAELLAGMGFRRVMNMVGGMLAYTAAGLPVERR